MQRHSQTVNSLHMGTVEEQMMIALTCGIVIMRKVVIDDLRDVSTKEKKEEKNKNISN